MTKFQVRKQSHYIGVWDGDIHSYNFFFRFASSENFQLTPPSDNQLLFVEQLMEMAGDIVDYLADRHRLIPATPCMEVMWNEETDSPEDLTYHKGLKTWRDKQRRREREARS